MEDWNALAASIGFKDELEMLEYFYLVDALSISQIALKLGVGTATINRRMSMLGIPKRRRGGKNRLSRQRTKLFWADQRWVYKENAYILSERLNIHVGTIWKYRKGRKPPYDPLRNLPEHGDQPVFDIKRPASSPHSRYLEEIQELIQRAKAGGRPPDSGQ